MKEIPIYPSCGTHNVMRNGHQRHPLQNGILCGFFVCFFMYTRGELRLTCANEPKIKQELPNPKRCGKIEEKKVYEDERKEDKRRKLMKPHSRAAHREAGANRGEESPKRVGRGQAH
ncbi:unnamed protein product [Ixodes persulcatus]